LLNGYPAQLAVYQRLHSRYKEMLSKVAMSITGIIGTHPSSLITELPVNKMLTVLEKTFGRPSTGQVRINALADFINTVCNIDQDPLEYTQILNKKHKEVNEHYTVRAANAKTTPTTTTSGMPDIDDQGGQVEGRPKGHVWEHCLHYEDSVIHEGRVGGAQGVSDARDVEPVRV
jgi:hypothetical protein